MESERGIEGMGSWSRKQKGPPEAGGPFLTVNSLALTYFRSIYLELSSAQLRFTVLFGMGRRGSKALWAPDITCLLPRITAEKPN